MLDLDNLIKGSDLLERKYWTNHIMNKIMGPPDHVEYDNSGRVRRRYWTLDSVQLAEEHPAFIQHRDKVRAKQAEKQAAQEAREEERRQQQAMERGEHLLQKEALRKKIEDRTTLTDDNIRHFQKAITSDLLMIDVPKKGDLDTVFETCKAQMLKSSLLLKISRTSSWEAYLRVYGHLRDPDINPFCQLYDKIAVVRPDMAYECGKRFIAKLYDIPYEKPWVTISAKSR